MKQKLEPINALAKIKLLIKEYYEDLGRGEEGSESNLIEDIDDIIQKVKIPAKYLIAERMEKDKEEEEDDEE